MSVDLQELCGKTEAERAELELYFAPEVERTMQSFNDTYLKCHHP